MFDPKGKKCPKCGRKGLHFSDHPHAFGWKDYGSVTCRFCHVRFKIKQGAKNTEQPTSEESCKAALRACLEALEVAQGYAESSGWTRHRDADIAQVESAITNARKALGE